MKKSYLIILAIYFLFSGCQPKKLSTTEINQIRTEIESVAKAYNKAIKDKNTAAALDLFSRSSQLQIVGTDSAEVFKTLEQVESHLKVDWELLTVKKIYDIKNVSIQISEDGTLASILYESPWDLTIADQMMHALIRFSWTMIKENDKWKIIHGMGQFATVGQSSEELLAQMKSVTSN